MAAILEAEERPKQTLLAISHTTSLKLPVEILNQEKIFALIEPEPFHESCN